MHAVPEKRYPKIYRMEDFYSDNMFDVASLSRLERELLELTRDGNLGELNEFVKFIGNAIKKKRGCICWQIDFRRI